MEANNVIKSHLCYSNSLILHCSCCSVHNRGIGMYHFKMAMTIFRAGRLLNGRFHNSEGLNGKLFRLSKIKSSDSLPDAKVPFHPGCESDTVLSRRRVVRRARFALQGAC